MAGTMPACTAGICSRGTCLPNHADCDGNTVNGCESDLTNTLAHCGSCGTACATHANSSPACTSGRCSNACAPGYGDCDGNLDNGCETNITNSASHCGACGRSCTVNHGSGICASSTCTLNSCTSGYGNCDNNTANGCETNLTNTTAHCGACGHACGAAPMNGSAACTAGACTVTCMPGYTLVAGMCVDNCTILNGGCDMHATCAHAPTGVTCTCQAGYAGDGHTCLNVAGSLSGLRWELSCIGHNGHACNCSRSAVVDHTTCGGAAGVTYDVRLRFRGVVETRTYTGGTADGNLYIGGPTPSRGDTHNIYSLTISNPPQTYYVNHIASGVGYCVTLDFQRTVQIAAGATVTLTADGVDGVQLANYGADGHPIVIPGIAPAPSAFDGEFVQVDVLSVTPRP